MNLRNALFICGFIALGIVIGMTPFPSDRAEKAEQSAEDEICQTLATEVKAGTIRRLDYMTTRCPARLLVEQEGAK